MKEHEIVGLGSCNAYVRLKYCGSEPESLCFVETLVSYKTPVVRAVIERDGSPLHVEVSRMAFCSPTTARQVRRYLAALPFTVPQGLVSRETFKRNPGAGVMFSAYVKESDYWTDIDTLPSAAWCAERFEPRFAFDDGVYMVEPRERGSWRVW